MKISTRSHYAVRALFHMAYHSPNTPMKVAQVSEAEAISASFLDQIFQSLRKAGIVQSKRGPRGGFVLARPPRDITLKHIICAVEGASAQGICRETPTEDTQRPTSGIDVGAQVWQDVAARIDAIMNRVTLEELVLRGERMGLHRPSAQHFTYVI